LRRRAHEGNLPVLLARDTSSSKSGVRWGRVLLILGGLVFAAGGVVAAYPMWADSWAQGAVVQRVEKLTGGKLTFAAFDLEYTAVHMKDAVLTLEGGAQVRLEQIDVKLDRDALWSGRAVVTSVDVEGGSASGDVAVFERLAADVAGRVRASGGESGRIQIVPQKAAIRGLKLDLTRALPSDHDPTRTVKLGGVVEIEATLAEPQARLTLRDVDVSLGERALRAASIATTLRVLRDDAGVHPQFPLEVAIEGAATALTPQIAVADIRGTVRVADAALSEVAVDLAGGFSDEAAPEAREPDSAPLWSLQGKAPRDLSSGSIDLTMESFKLGRIPAVLAQLPVVRSEDATIGGNLKLAFSGGKADIEGDLELAGLNVDHPMLARDPVLGLGFAFDFSAEVDPAARRVTVEAATLRRGAVEIDFDGEFIHPAEQSQRKYKLHLKVPKVACQEVIKAMPAEMVPTLVGFELKGDFELEMAADIDYADLSKVTLTGRVEKDKCKPVKVPQLVSADRLSKPFIHRATMRDGSERTVDLSEGSGSYTPLDQISPYMVASVMSTEDGGFWKHKGFITSQFQAALRRNLEAGKIRLGASTITMQMVKNVLLSHERTLSRKLQEMFLTWYVEQTLTKQRIMEIYLNVIEFGPGIYGVTRAAQHYYGKAPLDLTPPEAAYLALMLPSPVRRHVNYCEGGLTPVFQAKMKRLLSIMHTKGRLDPETYEVWKEGVITFDLTDLVSKKECNAEIARLLAAQEQQRSLSGLWGETIDDDAIPIGADEVVDAAPARPTPGRKGKPPKGFDEAALDALDDDSFMQAAEEK
jgi:hypothetical protein